VNRIERHEQKKDRHEMVREDRMPEERHLPTTTLLQAPDGVIEYGQVEGIRAQPVVADDCPPDIDGTPEDDDQDA
jgi:hypothetical protein